MADRSVNILIVEDEEQLARMMRAMLMQSGYGVEVARSASSALGLLRQGKFDVILLDLGLPDADGKSVIAAARAMSAAPILVVSARDSEKEKIAALDMGASDYIPKPFDAGELLARIRVALRPPLVVKDTPQSAPALELDFSARRAIVENRPVRLSRKEAELLRLLADADGEIVSHDKIINTIWGANSGADLMNLRVLAWQVRRKIEPNAASPLFLISEAGEGYRLLLKSARRHHVASLAG